MFENHSPDGCFLSRLERGTFSAPLQEINWSSIVFSSFSAEGVA
jgi:hypothetical protein